MGSNELVLAIAAGDLLVGAGAVEAGALHGRMWLLREPSSEAGRPRRLGISSLSRDGITTELEAGLLAVIDLRDGPAPRRWFAMRSAVAPVRPVVAAFMAFAADDHRPGSRLGALATTPRRR